jgi:flagellar biosynthesis/type III secretory pathway M-ring protein FliF/YscJ
MVEGFAKLVAGAVSGLKPQNVTITDVRTGRSYSVPDPEDSAGLDALSLEKKREEHLRSKILGTLADVPGVRVAVRVELDPSRRVTQKIRHDAPQPRMEMTQSSESNSGQGASESGVQANLGQSISEAAPGQSTSMEDSKVENFEPKLSQTETVEQSPFTVKKVTAAVGIPRSFVAGVVKLRHPEKSEPKDDDPEFVAVRDEQVSRVKGIVERIVMARDAADVEVAIYPDMEWSAEGGSWSQPGAPPLVQAGAEGFDALGLLKTYGPQAGLGLLALMSLLMVTRLANRASTVSSGTYRSMAPPPASESEPTLNVGAQTIGQALVSSDSVLTGREVDDDTLRFQELGDEVAKLVESDPEGTAALLRRWVEET